jgi:DNA-binding NarL/FixJ family response regulator
MPGAGTVCRLVTVYVLTTYEDLAVALRQWLRQHDHMCVRRFVASSRPGHDDMVMASGRDCPPTFCSHLTDAGVRVIVLVPSPRTTEHEQYLRAGATAYLPMVLDFSSLIEALRDGAPGA